MIIINKPYITKKNGVYRICSEVQIEGNSKTLYYEAEGADRSDFCTERADAFLVGLLPLAMRSGQDIYVKDTISERLYFQLTEFYIPIIARHQEGESVIKIVADRLDGSAIVSAGCVATGASGGVDSFYSICKYYNIGIKGHRLTHLLFTNMCTLDNDEARIRKWFEERKVIIQKIAEGFNLKQLNIYSNLYEFYAFPYRDFSYYFACTYGSCALALQNLIRIYYQSSGVTLKEFDIRTRHDAAYFDLFNLKELSTESLIFYSTGIEAERLEKIEYISRNNSIVSKNLSVCAEEVSGSGHLREGKLNCGRCSKCLRTLAELFVFDRERLFEDVFELSDFNKNTQKELARMCCLNSRDFSDEIIKKLKVQRKIRLSFYLWRLVFTLLWRVKKICKNNRIVRRFYYKFDLDIRLNGYRDQGCYEAYINK